MLKQVCIIPFRRDYLLRFYDGVPVTAFVSETDIGGRIFYSEDLEQTNFRQIKTRLDEVLNVDRPERSSKPPGSRGGWWFISVAETGN